MAAHALCGFFDRRGNPGFRSSVSLVMPHGLMAESYQITLRLVVAVSLVCALSHAQDTPKEHVRFFNDSAKAVAFYIDGQLACSVSANPEKNNTYCDAGISSGRHALRAMEPKLASQTCDLFVAEGTHVEAVLSNGERLYCRPVRGKGD